MKHNIIILQLLLLFLTGCHNSDVQYVDFTDLGMAENATFRVTAQKTTDLSELTNDAEWLALWGMADTTVMDKPTVAGITAPQRASSTTLAGIMQELLDFSKSTKAIELSGLYKSIDVDGQPTILSGKVSPYHRESL